jgi:NADPH-dependent 2,4-dienoyl-CoA reductase/sulfur reductase-like enzyme
MQGREVTLVLREDGIGARVFPGDLARWLMDYYRDKGVTVRSGGVTRMESGQSKFQVHLDSGNPIPADAVVAGLGIEPNVRTSRPEIFAAGDVANFPNPALGKRLRVEHEDNANTMGETAGRNLAGAGRPYDHLPFFYSDLFDLGYEAVGDVSARHQTVADWKEKYQEGVVYYLESGRVRGVLLWNVWNQVDAARALIAEPGPFRPEQLKGRLPAG